MVGYLFNWDPAGCVGLHVIEELRFLPTFVFRLWDYLWVLLSALFWVPSAWDGNHIDDFLRYLLRERTAIFCDNLNFFD